MHSIILSTVPFYFATLESYYLGGVFLPVVNAISDGSIVCVFLCFLTSYTPFEYLIGDFWIGFRLCQVLSFAVTVVSFGISIGCIVNIATCDEKRLKNKVVKKTFYSAVFQIIFLVLSFVLPVFWSPTRFFDQYPRMGVYLYGVFFLRSTVSPPSPFSTTSKLILYFPDHSMFGRE
jgi:hypothetical protein